MKTSLNTQIESVKNSVKAHTVVPFTTKDIECDQNRLVISERYSVSKQDDLLKTLGLRNNLTNDIFKRPQANWQEIKQALTNIKNRQFSCIVDPNNNVVSVINRVSNEPQQLNFDDRIDSLVNTIDASDDYSIVNVHWRPSKCAVQLDTVNKSEVNAGDKDFWQFGTAVDLTINNQQYNDYFLRLICSNGMTSKEKIAYRSTAATKNIGKQFLTFAMSNTTADSYIKTRCDALRGSRASLYEFNSVANALPADMREALIPEYRQIKSDFERHGYDITDEPSRRQKVTYTNLNAYDVFNRATYIASHERDVIEDNVVMKLNKAAADMFVKGPNLKFNTLDIYAGAN